MSEPSFVSALFRRNALPLSLALSFCLLSVGSLRADTSVIAVDVYNKKIHVEQGAGSKRPVGGLAKVATALVALDWSDVTKVSLNTLASVTPDLLPRGGANTLGLIPGDQLTLRDLIYAAMMSSDDLAATTLAAFVGQDINMRRSVPFMVLPAIVLGYVLVSSYPPGVLFGLFLCYALSGYIMAAVQWRRRGKPVARTD